MAEKDEIEDLKKLFPKERIAKLKKLQEKGKREIAEAQKMIGESEEQLAIEEEVKDIPIPQVKTVDIEHLFSPEEKELFRVKRFIGEEMPAEKSVKKETVLEETLAADVPREPTPEQRDAMRQYEVRTEQMSQKPADEMYNRMRNIYQQFNETGELTPRQMNEVSEMQYAQVKKMDDIQKGGYLPSEQAAHEMILTQRMANWLNKMYRS